MEFVARVLTEISEAWEIGGAYLNLKTPKTRNLKLNLQKNASIHFNRKKIATLLEYPSDMPLHVEVEMCLEWCMKSGE